MTVNTDWGNVMDEWGRDPSVKAMRRVFKAMEKTLDDLLEQLDVSPFDFRIRGWLEQALANFERAWGEAGRMGVRVDEKIDLVTSRRLKGHELLMRTRGWWTVEPEDVQNTVETHGRLVLGEKGELMVELTDQTAVDCLSSSLTEKFSDQVLLAP